MSGANSGRRRPFPPACTSSSRARFPAEAAPSAANQPREDARHLDRHLKWVAEHGLKDGELLLVMIDALDEADDPKEVIGFLPPQPLPRGVFFILSCRPPSPDNDYLVNLGGYEPCLIDPDSPNNQKDAADFFLDRLAGMVGPGEATDLARGTGGIFELATHVVGWVRSGQVTVAEALRQVRDWEKAPSSQRLTEFYKRSWKRIRDQFVPGERQFLTDLATLLVATEVGEWFPAGDGLEILPRICGGSAARRGPGSKITFTTASWEPWSGCFAVLPERTAPSSAVTSGCATRASTTS